MCESHLDLLSESVPVECFIYGGDGDRRISHLAGPGDDATSVGAAALASADHSDLVAGVYEGGMKIWECSRDLAEYLAAGARAKGRRVLELGCGAGLPGLHCLAAAAAEVHFQDFNSDVIERLTIPNVLLNAPEGGVDGAEEEGGGEGTIPETRFFSGDWSDLAPPASPDGGEGPLRLRRGYYDLILTSETIYSLDSQPGLLSVLDGCLADGGEVLLAAKTHYFGVGGGLRQFEEALDRTGKWEYRTVKNYQEGVRREILSIKRTQ